MESHQGSTLKWYRLYVGSRTLMHGIGTLKWSVNVLLVFLNKSPNTQALIFVIMLNLQLNDDCCDMLLSNLLVLIRKTSVIVEKLILVNLTHILYFEQFYFVDNFFILKSTCFFFFVSMTCLMQ